MWITNSGTWRRERIYLGGFEIWRKYILESGSWVLKDERETVHISDDHRRICMIESLTWDDGNEIADQDVVPRRRFQFDNHLGTACVETDHTGAVISYEEYHPYGTSSYRSWASSAEVSAKRYRYTGKERDEETSLYYHGARYYAPWLGRWMSADPAGTVDGTNLFAYVRGSPVVLSDPSGTQSAGEGELQFTPEYHELSKLFVQGEAKDTSGTLHLRTDIKPESLEAKTNREIADPTGPANPKKRSVTFQTPQQDPDIARYEAVPVAREFVQSNSLAFDIFRDNVYGAYNLVAAVGNTASIVASSPLIAARKLGASETDIAAAEGLAVLAGGGLGAEIGALRQGLGGAKVAALATVGGAQRDARLLGAVAAASAEWLPAISTAEAEQAGLTVLSVHQARARLSRGTDIVEHHVFLRKFAKRFEGTLDVEDYVIDIADDLHDALHAGRGKKGVGTKAGLWEADLVNAIDDFASANGGRMPNRTQLEDIAKRLMKRYGIDPAKHPFHRYTKAKPK